MNALGEALVWLNDPLNWQGPGGVRARLLEHLAISALAVLLGALVALPVACWLGHRGRGGGVTVLLTNLSRAVPVLALLTIFAVTNVGFGNGPTVLALAIFAVPPLLANAYVGIRGVDRDVVEAARGVGMSEGSILRRVEIPLALPLIAAGVRTAAVQVVATATIAALVGGGGLGNVINLGFGVQDQAQILGGAIVVAVLAVLTEVLLAAVQWAVTPGRLRRLRSWRPRGGAADPVAAS